ncbi:MAG TPA: DUF2953 domain-containing protein [Clostridiaceae bacterium]|nr:DUF2953 domain-containing protein [Clostridiaceae bacterium]
MRYLVIFFIVILTLALLFLLTNGYVVFEYNKDKKLDNLIISIFSFGQILKYKYEIPLIDFKNFGIKSLLVAKRGKSEKTSRKEKKFLSIREFIRRYKYFKESNSVNLVMLQYLWNRSRLKELRLNVVIGTDDAALTGLIGGMVWSIIGILDSYLSNKFISYKKHINVKTNFSNKEFKVDFYCIFAIRFVHIIRVGIGHLYNHIKKKFKSKSKRSMGGDFSG